MKTYKPWEGFTPEQAIILNWTEDFITRCGDSVDRIILESMQTEYPNGNTRVLKREHFWDVHYILETKRDWSKFHSRLGISTSEKDWTAVRVYPIWASYPECFDAPRQSWDWGMGQLAQHFYTHSDSINGNSVSRQQIDFLLSIQWKARLVNDEMISQIQRKIKALKGIN